MAVTQTTNWTLSQLLMALNRETAAGTPLRDPVLKHLSHLHDPRAPSHHPTVPTPVEVNVREGVYLPSLPSGYRNRLCLPAPHGDQVQTRVASRMLRSVRAIQYNSHRAPPSAVYVPMVLGWSPQACEDVAVHRSCCSVCCWMKLVTIRS